MAADKAKVELKDYAGGWIQEKKGTNVPAFLRGAYFVIFGGALAYLIIYMYGEVNHADRGPLVRQFNQTTQTSEGLMYLIAGLAVVFFIAMVVFAFSQKHEE